MHAVAAVAVHWTHCPALAPPVAHAVVPARAEHSVLVMQPRQTLLSQTGVAPLHRESSRQATQRLAVVLQTGVAPAHAVPLLMVHWTHWPLVAHAGVEPPQSSSRRQPRHTLRSQMGVVPEHWVLLVHWTHRSVGALQTGVEPVHAVPLASVHWTHAPALVPLRLQALAPLMRHSLSAVQARQVREESSHTGVVPVQSVSSLQLTQRLVSALQTVAMPVQAVRLAVVHWTQRPALDPLRAQAGVEPPQSLSLAQARQVLLVRLQMGVAPLQSLLLRHWTQRLLVVLQTGVPPVQAVRLAFVHWTQR